MANAADGTLVLCACNFAGPCTLIVDFYRSRSVLVNTWARLV